MDFSVVPTDFVRLPAELSADRLWELLSDPRTLDGLARVGKSYGNGAVKVEPRALERLQLPAAPSEA